MKMLIKKILSGKPVRQVIDEACVLTEDFKDELKSYATDDYQNRGGDYPESGEPDVIDVYGDNIECSFKNTSEDRAKRWLERFLNSKGFTFKSLSTRQDGDYQDDWVVVYAKVTGKKTAESIVEARTFKVGENFRYKDKYDNWHDCTVLSRKDFDEEDPGDYAIGEITYSYPTLGSPHKETVRIYRSDGRDYGDEYFVLYKDKNAAKGWGIEYRVKP